MRHIDTTRFAPVAIPANLGPAPDLRWLAIADLVVDPRYQRDIDRAGNTHIRKIAEAFDWRLFSAVVVSPVPGGKYAIIDGQHRTTAAALAGQESVPCQVIQADHQEQARAFEAINGRKINVTRDQRYRAALAAGVAEALRLKRLTDAAGIELLTWNPSTQNVKPGQTTAHVVLQSITKEWHDEEATFVLRCARAAAGEMPCALRAPTLAGIRDTFLDCPDWIGRAEVLSAFELVDLDDLFRNARADAQRKPGTSISTIIAAKLVTHVKVEIGGGERQPFARLPQLPFDASSVR